MGILERLKTAGQRKSPADLIRELDADIAAAESTLPGLDAERADALLLGDLESVTAVEQRIAAARERIARLRERLTLLQAAATEHAEQLRSAELDRLHARAVQVRELGVGLIDEYEGKAAALAETVRKLTAVDAFIAATNRKLRDAGAGLDRVRSVNEERGRRGTSHDEVLIWWHYPRAQRKSETFRVRPGDPEPDAPAPLRVVVGYDEKGKPIYEFERGIRQQRIERVDDVVPIHLDALGGLVSLPKARHGMTTPWDGDSNRAATIDAERIVADLLAQPATRPAKARR